MTLPPRLPSVLYLCAEDMAVESGPTLHVAAIVKGLAALGHPTALAHRGVCELPGVRSFPVSEPGAGILFGLRLRRALRKAAGRALDEFRPAVLYCRGSFPDVVSDAGRRGIPTIVEYNGVLAAELETSGVPGWRRRFPLAREASVARACAGAVAVDVTTREGMVARYPELRDKVTIVRNGCDVESFRDALLKGGERDHRRLVFVGGFHPWTRLDFTFRALARLPEDVRFDVYGDGPRRAEFEATARDAGVAGRVTFHGRVPHRATPEKLAACGVGVALESGDAPGGQPLKIAEYLAAGCAVVTNAYQGLEFIEKLGFGKLIAFPPSPERVAEALAAILDSGKPSREALHARHDFAARELSWSRAAREIADVLVRSAAEPVLS